MLNLISTKLLEKSNGNVIEFRFNGKSVGSGAKKENYIISLNKSSRHYKKLIPVHSCNSTRTGNHWIDTWFLKPGVYIVVQYYLTGNGNEYIEADILEINFSEYKVKQKICSYSSLLGGITIPLTKEWEWIAEEVRYLKKCIIIEQE